MSKQPLLVAMDLEGVLVPEIWIAVAEKTGIEKLRLTTRDVADYDVLMQGRLDLLRRHGLRLADLQKVIGSLEPMPGADELLTALRERFQVVILSDTFYEFAAPLMCQLGWPTLFCNNLIVDDQGQVVDYRLRQKDGKRHSVQAFKRLNFDVLAVGDSYNDTTMLAVADLGVLFRPSDNVRREFPQFPVAMDYADFEQYVVDFFESDRQIAG